VLYRVTVAVGLEAQGGPEGFAHCEVADEHVLLQDHITDKICHGHLNAAEHDAAFFDEVLCVREGKYKGG
jgi:hypothetical protein